MSIWEDVLVVSATIDISPDGSGQWQADGLVGMQGVFATGASFHEARQQFAANALIAHSMGSEITATAVRVIAMTRKTFVVGDLSLDAS